MTTLLVFWLLLAFVVGLTAERRFGRNSFGWFVLAAALSPLVAIILLLAMGKPHPATGHAMRPLSLSQIATGALLVIVALAHAIALLL